MTDLVAAASPAHAPTAPAPAAGAADAPAPAAVFPGDGDMARRCRALDWAATPLGPAAAWPASLRTAVGLCLAAPGPMALSWGPALALVYNDAYRAVLGSAKDAWALGRPTREVWAEVWDQIAPDFAALTAGGPVTAREDQRLVIRRDGRDEETFFSYALVPVRDEAGRVGGGLHVFTETTGRVRAEAALRAERERLRAVILHMPAPVALLEGPEHRFTLVNDAFRRVSGGGRDVTGLTPAEAFPELAGTGLFALHDRVYESGEPWVGSETLVRYDRDGTGVIDTWWDLRFEPVRDAGADGAPGRVTGFLNFAVDVTAQVRARQEVERLLAASEAARAQADAARRDAEAARAEAERADRAKSEFLATMSHEIRTPINAITGYAQLLGLEIAGPVTPAQRDYLTRLATAGQHLLGLVNDVLDLAKVDAGEVTVAREPATTEGAVTAALDLVRPQAAARGVALVDGNPDVTTPYVGDEHRVRQILVNLLSNAVKFTPAGGAVTVTCALAHETPAAARLYGAGPWAAVRVADTGVGIAPDQQAAVFEPFHQVHQAASGRGTVYTRTAGGTGLGLAISRRLARLMGGDLTLESAPGHGSTFTLWLPAAGGVAYGVGGAEETAVARVVRAAHARPGLVRGLGELGELLRQQLDALVAAYTERLRAEPGAPQARAMKRAELEDHLVTALADLAQSLVIVGEAGSAEVGLLADSMAINEAVAGRHGARRAAQGWDEAALRRDYAVLREVLARAVRADARQEGADAETALGVLLGFVEQSETRAVAAWRAADPRVVLPPP